MSNGLILLLMTALFLLFGYMGVPVAFALMAGVLVACALTPISMQSMIGQMFHGIDSEILLAVPFFLLVGELMTSADVTGSGRHAVQHVLCGHLRLVHGGRGCAEPHGGAGDGQGGLRPGIHCRAHCLRLDHGEPHSSEHHGGGVRRDR
jgi:hypothetical protein